MISRKDLDEGAASMIAYWQARYANFRFLVTLTRGRREGELHRRIPDILPGLFSDLSAYSVFVAGNLGFVDA